MMAEVRIVDYAEWLRRKQATGAPSPLPSGPRPPSPPTQRPEMGLLAVPDQRLARPWRASPETR